MERSKTSEFYLHLSFPALEKVEALEPSDFSTSQEGGLKCNYWLYDFAVNSEKELSEHIIADHASEDCDEQFFMYKLIISSV